MPLIDVTHPDVIKFFIENYDKTARLRMKWNVVHAEKLKKAATLDREEKGLFEHDVIKAAMVAGMPTITRDNISEGVNKRKAAIRDGVYIPGISDLRKGHSIIDVGLGDAKEDPRLGRPDTDLTIDPIMKPVDPAHKAILYQVIPKFGRKVYLKSRQKLSPENKYYFRETSGWEYGWRLGDSYFNKAQCPDYGRVWHLTRDSLSRTGPHPDPEYYIELEQRGPTRCNNA